MYKFLIAFSALVATVSAGIHGGAAVATIAAAPAPISHQSRTDIITPGLAIQTVAQPGLAVAAAPAVAVAPAVTAFQVPGAALTSRIDIRRPQVAAVAAPVAAVAAAPIAAVAAAPLAAGPLAVGGGYGNAGLGGNYGGIGAYGGIGGYGVGNGHGY